MTFRINRIILSAVFALAFTSLAGAATTKYVTDDFEVTMRSGTSTANEILRMLKSGEAVTVLEENLNAGYTRVEVEGGKKGYVLSRYLVESPSSKFQLEQIRLDVEKQQNAYALLQSENQQLLDSLDGQQSENRGLKSALSANEKELKRVRNAAQNTLSIVDENEKLKSQVDELGRNSARLSEENKALRDTSNMDWFIRGAGVSLIAFLLGILMTRIRWRKKDSWGSY